MAMAADPRTGSAAIGLLTAPRGVHRQATPRTLPLTT